MDRPVLQAAALAGKPARLPSASCVQIHLNLTSATWQWPSRPPPPPLYCSLSLPSDSALVIWVLGGQKSSPTRASPTGPRWSRGRMGGDLAGLLGVLSRASLDGLSGGNAVLISGRPLRTLLQPRRRHVGQQIVPPSGLLQLGRMHLDNCGCWTNVSVGHQQGQCCLEGEWKTCSLPIYRMSPTTLRVRAVALETCRPSLNTGSATY